jgi:hypothetical protein
MKIELSKTGLPVAHVGGYSFINIFGKESFKAQIVLNRKRELKNAIFIRPFRRENFIKQAFIVIKEGNYIVEIQGENGAGVEAWAAGGIDIYARQIKSINTQTKEAETVDAYLTYTDIPARVWDGVRILDNQDATYFCNPPIPKSKKEWKQKLQEAWK